MTGVALVILKVLVLFLILSSISFFVMIGVLLTLFFSELKLIPKQLIKH